MKHIFKILILLIIISCSKNSSDDNIEPQSNTIIDNITPLKAKIGDTITINGSNLNNLNSVLFKHNNNEYTDYNINIEQYEFISKNNERITLEIPELIHEDISIIISNEDDFSFDLVGVIPTINNFDRIDQIQVLDDKTAFILSNDKIYKSKDGFYNWTNQIELSNKDITSFFFLNESVGWIAVMENSGRNIYLTSDGGNNLTLKFQINNLPNSILDGSDIRKIQFISESKGLFKDGNGNIFITNNNSFENIYDNYPNLSSLPFGKIELWDFNIINEDLIFLAPNGNPNLIKINGQNITHSGFNVWPSAPLFFENIGYVQVNSDIYKTLDLGDSWSKIKTYENHYPVIHFLDDLIGFSFVNYSPDEIHFTKDGGATWEKYFTFPEYHNAHKKDFTQTNGIMGSYNGKTWKYRKEE